MSGEGFGPDDLQRATNVSRETLSRLKLFVGLLEDWNGRHNLVSRRSLSEVWRRHILDSAQLLEFIPSGARSLVDLGSGAGFPGLILATLLCDRADFHTVLYEATRKKCEFLALAAEQLGVAGEVRNARIEDSPLEIFDVVTARACAPLPRLFLYAEKFQGPQTRNLFLKGQNVGAELAESCKSLHMKVERRGSQSDPSGTVLVVEGLRRVG